MRRATTVLFAGILGWSAGDAQQPSTAASMGLIVYPGEGQAAETQQADEAACYQWAREATGIDPLNLSAEVATAQQPEQGGGPGVGRRAVRGAAGAALIADIADADTNEAAWAGAVVGGARGAREKQVRAQASQQAAPSEADAKAREFKETFNKAFAACLEGKHYTVKY